jgi:Spy/CpxP family protein refolding chaperone
MTPRVVSVAIALGLLTITAAPAVVAQGRGGGSRGGAPVSDVRSRLEIITDAFTLDKDQKKAVKETLDAAYKGADSAALKTTRTDLGAALQGGKAQAEIDAAARAYAAQAAAMAEAEMKALAQVLTPLRPEQRAQGTMTAFYVMRGIFLDDKKWDEIPEMKAY